MSKITITQAAKMAGISRQHLYKSFINTGKISVLKENNKSIIEMSELLRVFSNVKLLTNDDDTGLHDLTKADDSFTGNNKELVNTLKAQLVEAKEREEWFKVQIDELRRQQTNLLENKAFKKRKKFLGIF